MLWTPSPPLPVTLLDHALIRSRARQASCVVIGVSGQMSDSSDVLRNLLNVSHFSVLLP
jgi:hypothetical protein